MPDNEENEEKSSDTEDENARPPENEESTSSLSPRKIGELIEDLREELEEIRMEVNLLDGRLNRDLTQKEYNSEKDRLSNYMKSLIARITDLQKSISKKDRDLAREIRQLESFFQIEDKGNDQFIIYLAAGPEHIYTIDFSLTNYPQPPEITWPQEAIEELGEPSRFLKQLRDWDPAYPPSIYEVFQAFELYAFNYYNAVQELKDELRMIEGEFVMQLLKDNYIRITLMSFDKQEYHVEVNLERYPNLEWIFTPELEQVVGGQEEFMQQYLSSKGKIPMIDVLHDISWGIDKRNRLVFDYKVLVNNVSEAISDLKIDNEKKIITGCINGELKTASVRFEFMADFSKGYPEQPPEISLSPVGDVEQSVLDKLETFIADSGATWSNTSFFIDLLNQIHMAIFKSSIVTCVLCHKLFCPDCDEPLYLPKGKQGKTCFVECANCHRPYHKHCFEKTIQTIGKCSVCMQSFVAEDGKGKSSNLELNFK
ncbi:MAG TPA: hypothetical protein VKM55_04540 [Candidatus Lokiarchaeia archaeon]|nr:hypothetical protein [Candidatus Lokiarchaeia archaeon]